MPLRVAVTGINGQIGRALSNAVPTEWELSGARSSDVDVRSWGDVRDWIASCRPGLVIHAAAMTDVDGCESRVDDAFAINALGTRHVARAAERVGATLVYISTNFVFDGQQDRPYHEFDQTGPISVYGASKLAGEREALDASSDCYIVRTATVFDETGRNFVNTMRRLMQERDEVSVVDDQIGNPTYAPDFADGLLKLLESRPPGVYHLTNSGATSWFEWAWEIQLITGYACHVRPTAGANYVRAATPPRNGSMASLAWPDVTSVMPDWRDALRRCLTD
ncbi:dTDP-4-dehydrorhamnose reductase [soil metagenome]